MSATTNRSGWRVQGRRNEHWAEHALCAEVFGLEFERLPVGKQIACCRACPVRRECLDYALRVERPLAAGCHSKLPVFGGLTREQRAELERGRRHG